MLPLPCFTCPRRGQPAWRSAVWAVAVLLALAAPCFGDIIATTGQVLVIPPPPSVFPNVLQSNEVVFAFPEQQNIVLPVGVGVNITQPGLYNSLMSLTPGTLPAGTAVSSFYLHADPVGTGTSVTYIGSVTFDSDILGVILLDPEFNASDGILGAAGTLYPTGLNMRQVDLGPMEFVIVSPDRRTLSFQLITQPAQDDVRIITASGVVPEPGSFLLLALGLAGLVGVRRWRRG